MKSQALKFLIATLIAGAILGGDLMQALSM